MKILLDTNVLISAFIVHGVCNTGDKDLLVLKRFDYIDIVSPSEFSEYEAMKQAG